MAPWAEPNPLTSQSSMRVSMLSTARVTAMEDELHKLRGHLNALRAELGPDVA